MASNKSTSEPAIPSVTETLRTQRREQQDKARGVENAASRRTDRLIAEQNRSR